MNIIFVTTCRFRTEHSGLARRTSLAFAALNEIQAESRILVAPRDADIIKMCDDFRWRFVPAERYTERKRGFLGTMTLYCFRWSTGLLARVSHTSQERLLSMMGGSDLAITSQLKQALSAYPSAIVWLSRSDLLNVLRYTCPHQCVILDANDSTANLVRVYNYRATLRRLALFSRTALVAMLRKCELSLARKCNSVIAISEADARYFAAAGCNVVLEESCVLSRDIGAVDIAYDVGFVGSNHGGSVSAAKALIALAGSAKLAGLRFAIAGGVCRALKNVESPTNLRLVGEVPDSALFLRSCRQIVLWSPPETGTSVKFQEAVLSGATVLANSNAARWAAAVPGHDFVLCDSLDEIHHHILAGTRLPRPKIIDECTPSGVALRFQKVVAAAISNQMIAPQK